MRRQSVKGVDADRVVTLRDGRRLGYAEYGAPAGTPLLYFHGMPGSRLLGREVAGAATTLGVRVVAPDRPGMGLSDFQADRTIAGWAEDVVELADLLKIDRFAVMGASGGGPYALACAWAIPDRLTAVAVVAGAISFSVPAATKGAHRQTALLFRTMHRAPWLIKPLVGLTGALARHAPERLVDQVAAQAADPDREMLARPDVRAIVLEAAVDAFRGGNRGPVHEMRLFAAPWDFELGEIRIPVQLWQGEADLQIPPAAGRYLAGAIPTCRATFLPGAGHLWRMVHMEEILEALLHDAESNGLVSEVASGHANSE